MTIADTAWWLDGISLDTKAYYVRSVDEDTPTRRGDNQPTPGVSGRRYVAGKPFDERLLTLMMVIDAQPTTGGERSGAQLKANLDVIKKLFGQDGQHTLKRTHGGVDRQLTVEVRRLRIARGGPFHYNVAAELVAADPYWYVATASTFTKVVVGSLPTTLSLTNNGTYKVEKPLVTIDGPVTNPKVQVGDSWVQWTGVCDEGWQILIDTGAFTALKYKPEFPTTNLVPDISWATDYVRWLEIPVGSSTATLSGSGATANVTKLTIAFYEAYL